MKDYKDTYCIEGEGEYEYFSCPRTISPIVETEKEKSTGIISQELPLSTDNYSRSTVRRSTIVIFEK